MNSWKSFVRPRGMKSYVYAKACFIRLMIEKNSIFITIFASRKFSLKSQ